MEPSVQDVRDTLCGYWFDQRRARERTFAVEGSPSSQAVRYAYKIEIGMIVRCLAVTFLQRGQSMSGDPALFERLCGAIRVALDCAYQGDEHHTWDSFVMQARQWVEHDAAGLYQERDVELRVAVGVEAARR